MSRQGDDVKDGPGRTEYCLLQAVHAHRPPQCSAVQCLTLYRPPPPLQLYSRALACGQAGWGKEPSSMHGWAVVLRWAACGANLMHHVSACAARTAHTACLLALHLCGMQHP